MRSILAALLRRLARLLSPEPIERPPEPQKPLRPFQVLWEGKARTVRAVRASGLMLHVSSADGGEIFQGVVHKWRALDQDAWAEAWDRLGGPEQQLQDEKGNPIRPV